MRRVNDGEFESNADWNALARDVWNGNYVEAGCKLSQSGGLTVNLSPGTIRISGTQHSVSGGNITLDSNTSLARRYDLIRSDSAGNSVKVSGTVNRKVPQLNSGVGFGFVKVVSGASSLGTGDIYDSRVTNLCGMYGHTNNASAHHSKTVTSDIDHGNVQGLSDLDHPQYIQGEDNDERIERGIITMDGPSGASDNTWDTYNLNNKTVNFSGGFNSTPHVFLESDGGISTFGTLEVGSRDTSSFEIVFKNFETTDISSNTYDVMWLAIST